MIWTGRAGRPPPTGPFSMTISTSRMPGTTPRSTRIEGEPGFFLEGITLRYGLAGEGSPYEEDWPDFFSTVNGSEIVLRYGNQTGPAAGSGLPGSLPGRERTGCDLRSGISLRDDRKSCRTRYAHEKGLCYLDVVTSAGEIAAASEVPAEFALDQNYPNPFNPVTLVRYHLPGAADVKLSVFDILGREVEVLVDAEQEAGAHQISWDADAYSSGVYILRMQASEWVGTRRMLLLK